MKARTRRLLIVVGIVLGAAAVPALSMLSASDGYKATAGTTYNATSGPAVELNNTYRIQNGSAFPDDNTVTLQGTTFKSDSHTEVTVEQFSGTYTNLTNLSVTNIRLYINPSDKPAAEVEGDLHDFRWRDPGVDNGKTDFYYNGSGGTATVVLNGVESDTFIGAIDRDTGKLLAGNKSTANGRLVLDGLPLSSHNVTLQQSAGNFPRVSDAYPVGDQSQAPTELNVTIDDLDFPNDNVTATFYLNGTVVGTDNRSTPGKLNTSINPPPSGTHNYTVVLEDKYSQTTTKTYQFGSPAELEIREETNPSNLIDNRQVNLTIYGQNQILTRNVSDGTMNLSGLPTGETLVVEAETNGYVTRRITINRLSQQEQIYLLNNSVTTIDAVFELRDFSGRFPTGESELRVQRSVNGSWDTIVADEFDATGEMSATLESNVRYRIVVVNTNTGDREVPGTITPVADGRFVIEISGAGVSDILRPDPRIQYNPSAGTLPALDAVDVAAEVDEGTANLRWFETTWYYTYPNGTRVQIQQVNRSSPMTVSESINLTNRAGGNVTVSTTWRLESGKTGTKNKTYRVRQAYQHQNSLLSVLGSVSTLLPSRNVDPFQLMVATLLTIGITASLGQRLVLSSVQTGAVALGTLSAWSVIGWVSYDVLFIAGVAFVTAIAVRRRL